MAFLNKLQVPALDGRDEALLMPKLQFRFRVIFENFGIADNRAELTRQVIDCSRPNLSFAKITVPVYNSTIYLAGKHTWQPMSINLRDDATGVVTQMIGGQLQKQLDFAEQASAASAQDYKFRMRLEMLDGANGAAVQPLEIWDLEGCYLESANYNTVNYGTSEVVTIALSVQYDNAIQLLPDFSLGTATPPVRNPTGLSTGDGA
jgi:hypothetical protein